MTILVIRLCKLKRSYLRIMIVALMVTLVLMAPVFVIFLMAGITCKQGQDAINHVNMTYNVTTNISNAGSDGNNTWNITRDMLQIALEQLNTTGNITMFYSITCSELDTLGLIIALYMDGWFLLVIIFAWLITKCFK